MNAGTPSYLVTDRGYRIAYHSLEGASPGVVFMGGFRSDMTGAKAMALEAFCRERGRAFLRFDYFGHGESDGKFEDGTIGRWKQDALTVLDRLTQGPQVLIGSSMGGWIMLLAARERADRVKGMIGIAAAPDFAERLLWRQLDKKKQKQMLEKGFLEYPDCYGDKPYRITRALIEEAREHLLLQEEIPIECPVRLLHGMKDEDVPWEFSLSLNEKLASEDVKVHLIPEGDHRLSSPPHLAMLCRVTEKLLARMTEAGH